MSKQKDYYSDYFKEDLEEANYSKKYNKYEARDSKRNKRKHSASDFFYD